MGRRPGSKNKTGGKTPGPKIGADALRRKQEVTKKRREDARQAESLARMLGSSSSDESSAKRQRVEQRTQGATDETEPLLIADKESTTTVDSDRGESARAKFNNVNVVEGRAMFNNVVKARVMIAKA